MANKLTFEIIVSDGGSAKLVQKGIEGVGKAAEGTTKKTKEASKAQDELNYKLNQGATGVSSAARSFSKLNQAIGSGPNGLVGAYATLAANAFAVSAAFNQLRAAAQVEQMMKGLEVQGARTGLSLKNVSSEVQKLTGYSVSAAEAMKTTALMASAGFSTQGMEELTKVATNAAYALGRSVPDALDRISKGVTKLEPELLDELGIMTKLSEAQSRYALENNKTASSLTSFEKRQAMLNAVVAEGTAKFGGLSDQVAANPFDQLGASFQNLINDILSIANTIAGPLATLFSNKGVLLGGIILFISTIRQQLLPVLYLMGKVANERRQHFLDMAADARDAAKATLELANAQQKAAMSAKMEKFVGPETRTKATPKGFDYETAAINAADQNAAAYAKDIAKLDNSISSRMKNIRIERGELTEEEIKSGVTARGWSQKYIEDKEKEVEAIKKVKASLQDLYKTQKEGEESVIAARARSRAENTKFRANEKAAAAEKLRGEAIELAGEGKVREAWAKRGEALDQYQKKLRYERIANQREGRMQLPPIFDKVKAGAAGVGASAQIASAAFMRFIPYIGIAVTAVGLLYTAWEKWGKSDAAKAHSKALEKYKETVDTAASSVKELKRLQEASLDVGLKAATTLTIQSNATQGIADALREVQKAQAEAMDTKKVDSWFEAFVGGRKAMISYQTGIGTDDPMFAAVESAYGGSEGKIEAIGAGIGALLGGGIAGYFTGGLGAAVGASVGSAIGASAATWIQSMLPEELNGIDEGALETARAVSNLSKIIGEDLTNSMVKAAGGAESMAQSPALQREFIRQAAAAYVGVADAVKTVQEGFKQTGDALTNFFSNAIAKTPFDSIVTGLTQINKGFLEMDLTLGGSNIVEQTKLLASMPQELERMLTPANATIIQNVRKYGQEIDTVRQQITELASREEDLGNLDKERLRMLRDERLPGLINEQRIEAEKGTSIREQLQTLESQNKSAQRQSRLYQNQLNLVNAIASANSEIYTKSVEGERARIARHNEAIRLQQTQLNIQINITETYIQQQEIALQALETRIETLQVERDILEVQGTASLRQAEATKNEARTTLIRIAGNERLADSIQSVARGLSDTALKDTSISIADAVQGKTEDFVSAARALVSAEVGFQRASRLTQTRIDIDERTSAIQGFRDNIDSLRTQVAALSQTEIRAGEEAALLRRKANEIAGEVVTRQGQIRDLTEEINQIERNTNNIYRRRSIELQENIRASIRQANTEKENQARQSGLTIQRLRDDQAVYRARLADHKDMASLERESYLAAIDNLDTQIAQEEQINRLNQQKIELSARQAVIESIVGGGLEETINRLKESLDLRKQELEVASELKTKQLEITQNSAKIAIARTGGDVTERTQKAFEVESAELAYQIAQEQHQLRLNAIDAEYALLDAKKNVDAQNLRTQVSLLQAYNRIFNNGRSNPELDAMISNVTRAASTLQGIDTQSMRLMARRSAEGDLELARQRRDLARAQYQGLNNPQSDAAQVFTNYVAEVQAMRRADTISRERIAAEQNNNQLNYSNQELELNQIIITNLEGMNRELQRIREAIIPAATALETGTVSSTSTVTGNVGQTVNANMNRATFLAATQGYFGGSNRSISNPTSEDIRRYINTVSAKEGNDYSRNSLGAVGRLQFMPDTLRGLAGNNAGLASTDSATQWAAWQALSTQQKDALYQQYARQNFNALKSAIGRAPTESEWYAAQFGVGNISAAINSPESSMTRNQRAAYSGNTPALVRGLAAYLASNISPTAEATATPVAPAVVAPIPSRTPAPTAAAPAVPAEPVAPINVVREDPGFFTAIDLANDEAFLEIQRKVAEQMAAVIERIRQKKEVAQDFIKALPSAMQVVTNQMAQLGTAMTERLGTDFGPQGRVMTSLTSLISTFSTTIPNALTVLNEDYATWAERNKEMLKGVDEQTARTIHSAQQIGAAFQAASAIIGSVASLLKSISDAKIAGIDKEIAAEQKRDGKSAASIAKIDALEKKKDAMARKSFNTQKKLMLAQAVMSTAAAVAGTYASMAIINPFAAAIMAGVIGAMGLAQVAIIAGTQYESSYTPKAASTPTSLSIGKRSDNVDLAKGPNANAGGEAGFLRGTSGMGSNASNYRTVGSAYGGDLNRGYGNRGFVVGEKGPEVINPETPITVTPANEVQNSQPLNATFNIQALDASGVQDILVSQKGNIIKMLRDAANASGQRFMEDVNVNVYTRPNVGKL